MARRRCRLGQWRRPVSGRLRSTNCSATRTGCRRRWSSSPSTATWLRNRLDQVARAGQLRVPPTLAARLLQAGVTGVTLSLIAEPVEQRDMEVSARMRESVIGLVAAAQPVDQGNTDLAARALALDAVLAGEDGQAAALRATETALLREWLQRLA